MLLAPSGALRAAQQPVLRGRVIDTVGTPISQVEIIVLGSPRRANTDSAGRFLLPLPNSTVTLQLRRIGYSPMLISLGARRVSVDTTLTMTVLPLELAELRVTGKLDELRFRLLPTFAIDDSLFVGQRLGGNYLPFGAALSDEGDVWVTTADRVLGQILTWRRWRFSDGRLWEEGLGHLGCKGMIGSPIAAQFINGHGGTAGAITDSGQVYLVVSTPLPTCVPLSHLPPAWHAKQAAGTAGRWYIAIRDQAGDPAIVGLSSLGTVRWSLPLGTWLTAESLPHMRMAARGALVTLALATPPFPWVVVDSVGNQLLAGSGVAEPEFWKDRETPGPDWEAFPLLPIEGGFVQTLASLDRRNHITVVYDGRGKVSRLDTVGNVLLIAVAYSVRRILGFRLSAGRGLSRLAEFSY